MSASKAAISLGYYEPVGRQELKGSAELCAVQRGLLAPERSFLFGAGSLIAEDAEAGEEEVYWVGDRLVWSSPAGVVRRQFRTATHILQATWCRFQGERTLCMLHHCAVTTYAPASGATHTVPLPARFARCWALPEGLLLSGAPGYGPCVLPHPLEDVFPLTSQQVQQQVQQQQHGHPFGPDSGLAPGSMGPATQGPGGGGWEAEDVLWTSTDLPYILTHNQDLGKLSLWWVRPSGGSGAPPPLVRTLSGALVPQATPMANLKTPAANLLRTLGVATQGAAMSSAKRQSLLLSDGGLSPAAFSPFPRSTLASISILANGAALLLPMDDSHSAVALVWEQAVPQGHVPTEAHLAADAHGGGPLLALLAPAARRLTVLRLPPPGSPHAGRVEVAMQADACAVAAISATCPPPPPGGRGATGVGQQQLGAAALRPVFALTGPQPGQQGQPPASSLDAGATCAAPGALAPKDLLLLQPNGQLALYSGCCLVCNIAVRPAPAAAAAKAAAGGVAHAGVGGRAGDGGAARPGQPATPGTAHTCSMQVDTPGSAMQMSEGGTSEDDNDDGGGEVDCGRGVGGGARGAGGAAAGEEEGEEGDNAGAGGEEDDGCGQLPDIGTLRTALEPQPEPIGLQDAVGDRVTVVCRDGRRIRVALPLRPASGLCTRVLQALREVLPGPTWHAIYAAIVVMPGVGTGCPQREWRDLSRVLLRWAASSSGPGARPPPPPPLKLGSLGSTLSSSEVDPTPVTTPMGGTADAGPAAWQGLLASPYHRHMVGLRDFRWWPGSQAAAGAGDGGGPSGAQSGAGSAPGLAAMAEERACRPAAAAAAAAAQQQQQDVWQALYCLHSMYEDAKLHTLRAGTDGAALGTLCCELAALLGAADYLDHYYRDLGAPTTDPCTGGSDGGASPAPTYPCPGPGRATAAAVGAAGQQQQQPPGDVFRCMQLLLRGEPPERLPLPLLVARQSGCVARSSLLLGLYLLISECGAAAAAALPAAGSADKQRAAEQVRAIIRDGSERMVVALVAAGWGPSDLETLPVGAVLPLQEALMRCRGDPPTDWPLEAYVLVGRHDIAASMQARAGGAAADGEPAAAGSGRRTGRQRAATAAVASTDTPLGQDGGKPLAHRRVAQLQQQRQQQTPSPCPAAAPSAAAGGGNGSSPSAPGTPSPQQARQVAPLPYTQRLQLPGLVGGQGAALAPADAADGSSEGSAPDGMEGMAGPPYSLRFSEDLRLEEVRRLLSTSNATPLRLQQTPEMSETDVVAGHQMRLMSLACRTLALPVGRGAFTVAALRPLPTEPLDVPLLSLGGCLPEQHNAVVHLNLESATAAPGGGAMADFTAWPEFHNGVAAGLRLELEPGGPQLTRTWIVYNKPAQPSYSHAGTLLALGLAGHLSCLAATDLYRYLSQEHDATTAAVLLGVSAARRGTMDATTSKMLFLHLPGRHPASYPDLEVGPLVQAAAAMGVGLLYQGTCHRLMADILLEEIGRRPSPNGGGRDGGGARGGAGGGGGGGGGGLTQDREAYALSAGLALGCVTLGKGRDAVGLADLGLVDRLRVLMAGSAQQQAAAAGGGGSSAGATSGPGAHRPSAVGGPMPHPLGPGVVSFDLSLGGQVLQHPLGSLLMPPAGATPGRGDDGGAGAGAGGGPGSSQTVLEPPGVANLDVTSPAATLALALAFLKTNDCSVAALFDPPATRFALDYVRPDLVRLRALARCLIMWDAVQPSEVWLHDQLPPLLRGSLDRLVAGQDGGGDGSGGEYEGENQDGLLAGGSLDREAVAAAHINAVAGACLGVGFRFAGSGSPRAERFLRHHLLAFVRAKTAATDLSAAPGAEVWGRVNKGALEGCIGTLTVALSLVMAGTGHLPTFKLLRALRLRLTVRPPSQPGDLINYGHHMACGMALGFLFLGGGLRTFSTNNEAIAALLASVYPIFPDDPRDQRYHLQALRHLYVLASQRRCLTAVDVDTKQPVTVPLRLRLINRQQQQQRGGQGQGGQRAAVEGGEEEEEGEDQLMQDTMPMRSRSPEASKAATLSTPPPEGAAADAAASGQKLGAGNRALVLPSLLPERQQVAGLEVCGQRYRPQHVGDGAPGSGGSGGGGGGSAAGAAGGGGGGPGSRQRQLGEGGGEGGLADDPLDALYRRQVLYVQRRAGALSYADDPSGMRSLLSRAFHTVAADQQHAASGTGAGERFDLVALCATFSASPYIMSFARRFCTEAGASMAAAAVRSGDTAGGTADGGTASSPAAAPGEFSALCRQALAEAIQHDKPAALQAYIQLHCLLQSLTSGRVPVARWPATDLPGPATLAATLAVAPGPSAAVQLWSLKMALEYYASGVAAGAAFVRGPSTAATGVDGTGAGDYGSPHPTQLQGDSSAGSLPADGDDGDAWAPVLSPTFLQGLWLHLGRLWTRLGLGADTCTPDGTGGGGGGGARAAALAAYLQGEGGQGRGLWRAADFAAAGSSADPELSERLLGAALAMQDVPRPSEAHTALLRVRQHSGPDLPPEAAVPLLSAALPAATPVAVVRLVAAQFNGQGGGGPTAMQ